jgi:hypothetical protein
VVVGALLINLCKRARQSLAFAHNLVVMDAIIQDGSSKWLEDALGRHGFFGGGRLKKSRKWGHCLAEGGLLPV